MILTPQALFLYRLLEGGQDVSIDVIAVTMSGGDAARWEPRYAQMRVGNRVAVLNKQLASQNSEKRVQPGVARKTYRLVTLEA